MQPFAFSAAYVMGPDPGGKGRAHTPPSLSFLSRWTACCATQSEAHPSLNGISLLSLDKQGKPKRKHAIGLCALPKLAVFAVFLGFSLFRRTEKNSRSITERIFGRVEHETALDFGDQRRHRPPQPGVFLLQFFHPPGLIHLQAAIFLETAVVALLGSPDPAARIRNRSALRQHDLGLTQISSGLSFPAIPFLLRGQI